MRKEDDIKKTAISFKEKFNECFKNQNYVDVLSMNIRSDHLVVISFLVRPSKYGYPLVRIPREIADKLNISIIENPRKFLSSWKK